MLDVKSQGWWINVQPITKVLCRLDYGLLIRQTVDVRDPRDGIDHAIFCFQRERCIHYTTNAGFLFGY